MAVAVAAYRASIAAGEPLSERALASRYGRSRRWARGVMSRAHDDPGEQQARPRLVAVDDEEATP